MNAKKKEGLAANYKQEFARNVKILLDKKLDLAKFYSIDQLAHPSAAALIQLLNHYNNNVNKAFHHNEKDPWFNRPHKKKDSTGKEPVANKEPNGLSNRVL